MNEIKNSQKGGGKCTNRNPAPPCKNGKIIGNRKLSNGKTEKCCYNPNYLKYIKKNN